MKKLLFILAIGLSSVLLLQVNAHAQTDKPYTDGPVWQVQFVQTKPGMYRTYLKDLSTHWVKMVKAAKSSGLIMDYKILASEPAAKTDWDLMLMIEVKNYAALDGIDDKLNALAKQLFGSEDKQHQSAISRNDMRDLLGGKLAQQLIFK